MIRVRGFFVESILDETKGEEGEFLFPLSSDTIDYIHMCKAKWKHKGKEIQTIGTIFFNKKEVTFPAYFKITKLLDK